MKRRSLLLGTGLLLSIQLPALYGSALFLSLLLLASLFSRGPSAHGHPRLSRIHALIAALGLILHYLVNVDSLHSPPDLVSVVHGSMYLLVAASLRGRIDLPSLRHLLVLLTIVSLALLVLGPVQLVREFAFIDTVNGLRFRSYFSEPSIAAIAFCLNIILVRGEKSKRLKLFVLLGNTILVVFTFSGTGLILLAVALLDKEAMRWIPAGIIALVAAALLFRIGMPAEFETIVFARVERLLNNDLSNSSFLRFIAPWLTVEGAFREVDVFLAGVGIGGLSDYLMANGRTFYYLQNYAGEQVLVLNNGYAVLFVLLGFPAAVFILAWMAARLKASKAEFRIKLLFLLLPFFSGAIWAANFWLLFYMAAGLIRPSTTVSKNPGSSQA